jgi:TRAP-type C4-dicarboxylate transport system substrate-binding protein
MIQPLGGTPVEIATADLSTAFERKMIDSSFLSMSAILSFGVKDVTTYRTIGGVFTRTWLLCMNKKTWDSLGPDLQKAVMDNCGGAKSKFYSDENDKLEAGAVNAIKGSDKGQGKPEMYVLPDSEKAAMKTALQPVTDSWIKKNASKVPSADIIKDFNEFAKKYAK